MKTDVEIEKTVTIKTLKPTLGNIINAIKFVTGVDIKNKTREEYLVYLRKIYYKIAKDNTNLSLKKIGGEVNKDHSTIVHHLKTFDDMLLDKDFKETYFKVLNLVNRTINKDNIKIDDNKTICFINDIVEVKSNVEFVEKLVDIQNCGIPIHIIEHLKTYTESELNELYETRLIPFKNSRVKTMLKL